MKKLETYTGGEYSEEQLLSDLRQRVAFEKITSYEEYKGLVDEIVEEKRAFGFFHPDENLEKIKSDLDSRWGEIKEQLERHKEKLPEP
ncbi:MAG TPA: hypothetical protein PLF30_00415 [Candidatus Moranbacteria bacterium]|jgi:hypothetical protein|nr:hypothetical protein [Candidatus Moranbacteria bacterium]HQB59257.1 hypothetical protein [Candidatus Moranbacteria bacterium]